MVFYQDKNIKLGLLASSLAVILTGCGGSDSSGSDDSSNDSQNSGTTQSSTSSEVTALNARMDAISYDVTTNNDTSVCDGKASSNYLIRTEHFNIVTETGSEVSQANATRAAQMAEIVWQDLIAEDMFDIDATNDTTIKNEAWTVCVKTASDSGFKGSALDYNELELGYTATVATDYVLMLHEMTHVLGENIAYLNAEDSGQTYTMNFSTMRWVKEAIATIAAAQAKIYNSEIESTFYTVTGSTVVSPALINSYDDSVNAGFTLSYDGYSEYYYYSTLLQAVQDQGTNFALKDWLYLYGDYDVLTDTTAFETRFNTLLSNKGITSFTLGDLQTADGFQTHILDYIAANYDKTVSFSADRTYTDFFIETDSIYQPTIEAVTSSVDSSKILYTTKNISDGTYQIYAGTSSGDYYGPTNITISGGNISGPLDLSGLSAYTD